ncbi:hypothetical protein T8S45_02420 [Blastomonas marina]|uniref:hypothetical protein n=1 Tax=Blastomonas marina TaxID=1867408 RepID=UPI002AC8D704|nr:hypothetical protein [Blastomonas marina]WPZ04412.1 hypothetical protein T8S45_02420 [Blastomonas marina]
MLRMVKGLACSLMLVATPALAEEWHEFAKTGETIGFVDTDTLRTDAAPVTFDMFVGYMYGQGKDGEVYYVIYRMSADCSSGTLTVLSLRAFDIDRKPIPNASRDTIEDPLAERTFASDVHDLACVAKGRSSGKTNDPYRASDDYFGGF